LLVFFLSNTFAFDIQEIKLGTINDFNLKVGSHAFKARANFHRVKITSMPNGEGIDQIRWTDKLSTSLDDTTFQKCPKDSAICGDAIDPNTNVQITIGACVDEIYIYVKISRDSMISFSGSYYQGDCDPIEENLYTRCGAMTYDQCDVCGDECRLAFCKKRQYEKEPEVKTSLCLPYNVTAEEINDRCDDYMGVDYGEWKESCNKSLEIGNIGALTIITLVLMTIAFFGFIGTVTWYNFKLRTTGKAPIKCFKFCPEILFPRPTRQAQSAQPLRGYQPPDIEIPDRR